MPIVCIAVARARLELGTAALAAQLAAIGGEGPANGGAADETADSAVGVALCSELKRLLAQMTNYDEQIRIACAQLDAGGLSGEDEARCHASIAVLRVARVSPVPVLVPTRRTLLTHRRAVDVFALRPHFRLLLLLLVHCAPTALRE